MSDQADHQMEGVEETVVDKGKGKAPQAPVEETEDDSSDESGLEEQVCCAHSSLAFAHSANIVATGRRYDHPHRNSSRVTNTIAAEPEEDNMEEIDTSNIVQSRTRGKTIDYAKAAAELGAEEEDDEDDDDFEGGDDAMEE